MVGRKIYSDMFEINLYVWWYPICSFKYYLFCLVECTFGKIENLNILNFHDGYIITLNAQQMTQHITTFCRLLQYFVIKQHTLSLFKHFVVNLIICRFSVLSFLDSNLSLMIGIKINPKANVVCMTLWHRIIKLIWFHNVFK